MGKASKKDKKEETKEEEAVNIEEAEEEDDDNGGDPQGDGSKKKRRKRKRKRKKAADADDDAPPEDPVDALELTDVDDDTPRTAFVEGVPYDANPEMVAECLVTYAKIDRSDILELRFPTWQDSGRMRGYGHVGFVNREVLQKVVQTAANSKFWMGTRYLSLQPAKPKSVAPASSSSTHAASTGEPSRTIMIKNLSYEATEDDIREVMEQFGPIVEGGIRIARNFSTLQSKGFAYIEYQELESAIKAMSPSKPIYIKMRACLLDYDEGRIKGSFKTASGRLWSKEFKQESNTTTSSNNKQHRTH